MKFYAQSKLANLPFEKELDNCLKEKGYKTKSFAAHSGFLLTNLFNMGKELTPFYVKLSLKHFTQPAKIGRLNYYYGSKGRILNRGRINRS